ncbi:unnamed protein product [Rotaria sp. Silwood1]|nr:unnamed protein product [Rotaria sp. Silwood1]
MPLRVRNILKKVGDELILKIQLGRTPVRGHNVRILNLLSHSKFTNKQLELGYDEIYHNYLLITIKNTYGPYVLQHMFGNASQNTTSTTILKLEKRLRISLKYRIIPDELIDVYDIPLTPNKPLTLNRLLSAALNVDKNFYRFDVGANNTCQTFVENIIDINGLLPNIIDQATLNALIPIDAKTLISSLGSRADIVEIATNLGAQLEKLVFDHKLTWKKSQPKEFVLMRNVNVTDSESINAIYNATLELEKNVIQVDRHVNRPKFNQNRLDEDDDDDSTSESENVTHKSKTFIICRSLANSFYLCQTLQNVYNYTKEICIRWCSLVDENTYFKLDYEDKLDPHTILTEIPNVIHHADKTISLKKQDIIETNRLLEKSITATKPVTISKAQLFKVQSNRFLKENLALTEYRTEPFFEDNLPVSFISSSVQSKLAIRAVILNDRILLKSLIDDVDRVCSVHIRHDLSESLSAIHYAIKNNNIDLLKILLEDL